jgi:hypothetical protein
MCLNCKGNYITFSSRYAKKSEATKVARVRSREPAGQTMKTAEPTSGKTKSPSLNLFSLLYPQTQKNQIEISLKYGIALLFQSVL